MRKCSYKLTSMVTDLILLHFRVLTLLCEAEAKLNIGDHLGNTPLHYACSNGHIQIVKYLMQNGGNPTSRSVRDMLTKRLQPYGYCN